MLRTVRSRLYAAASVAAVAAATSVLPLYVAAAGDATASLELTSRGRRILCARFQMGLGLQQQTLMT